MSLFQKETISYKYFFTPNEKEENSQLMANASVGIKELEDEKKAVMSEYKAKIDAKTSELNLSARHVIDKYTTKTGLFPKRKNFTSMRWEWFDEESGEIVKTEPLTGKDRQQDIPFAEPAKATTDEPTDEGDEDNGHEAVANPDGSGYFRGLPNAEARQLPSGENPDGDGGDDDNDDDDGTTFDADTFNPNVPPTPPAPPKNKGGRPRKNP